jgi:hypothetical protein
MLENAPELTRFGANRRFLLCMPDTSNENNLIQ